MRLSVMDQSVAVAGGSHQRSIQNTIALAEHCDRLGYHRFWVSEHHNHETIVGSAPEIVMAAIAARTKHIRIGSSGVMLPHYSALKVAEQFRVLDAIAPGRIDLGVGRAPGSDGRTAFALNPNAAAGADTFPTQVRDLEAWVTGAPLPEQHPFRAIRAFPSGETAPELWMLGSSDYGAQLAAYFGMPYCYAWFITDGRGGYEALELYRHAFRPSARCPAPVSAVCVWALVAETEEEAIRQFWPRGRARLIRDRGVWGAIKSPEDAAAHAYSEPERARIDELRRTHFVGTPASVGERLRKLGAELKLDDLVVLTWAYDPAVSRKSYELLAREFGLQPRD